MAALPSDWTEIELRYCGDWLTGRTPSKSNPAFWGGPIPWISPKTIKSSYIDGSNEGVTLVARDRGELVLVPAGSVLFVVRSGILKHSLPVAVTRVECAINQDVRALVPAEGVNARFLLAQLQHRSEEILRRTRQTGVTVDSLKQAELAAVPIVLPPTADQEAIADRLEQLMASILSARHNVAEAEALIDAVPGSLSDRLRSEAVEDFAPCTVSELSNVPIRTGLSIAGSSEPPGVKSLKLTALKKPRIDQSEIRYLPLPREQVERFLLEKGDIIIARGSGTRDLVARASAVGPIDESLIFPDTAYRVRLDGKVNPDWFVLMWNAPRHRRRLAQKAKTTAGIWKISTPVVSLATVPDAPRERQLSDLGKAARNNESLAKIRTRIAKATRLLDRTEMAIYQQAITGCLVARSGNDASKLAEFLMARQPVQRRRQRQSPAAIIDVAFESFMKAWPVDGLTFAELRNTVIAPYDDIKQSLFDRLAAGRITQNFDDKTKTMRLYVVAE